MFRPQPEPPERDAPRSASLALRFCLLPLVLLAVLGGASLTLLARRLAADVPDVAGMRLEEAETLLRRRGLLPALEAPGLPAHPDLPVAATRPEAGTRLWRNSRVVVLLGERPEAFRVPSLIGLSRTEALERLDETLFTLGTERVLHADAPPGILGQSPQPGELARGGLIDVLVSLGPAPALYGTPDLLGQRQQPVLELWGLELGRIEALAYRPVAEAGRRGTILEQEPDAGRPLGAEGLRLVVGAGPDVPLHAVLRYEPPPVPGGQEVTVVADEREVARRRVLPGSVLRLPVPVGREGSELEILLDGMPVARQRLRPSVQATARADPR